MRALVCRTAVACLILTSTLAGNGEPGAFTPAAFAKKSANSKVDFSQSQNAIETTLNAQAKAWNAGDLAGFMSAYSKRSETSYVSKDTQVYGYDAIETRYKKRYGDNRDSMGTLSFSDLKYVDVSPTSAICIGHWLVEKKDHERLSGVFSLVLVKEETGWKILHDHTS